MGNIYFHFIFYEVFKFLQFIDIFIPHICFGIMVLDTILGTEDRTQYKTKSLCF